MSYGFLPSKFAVLATVTSPVNYCDSAHGRHKQNPSISSFPARPSSGGHPHVSASAVPVAARTSPRKPEFRRYRFLSCVLSWFPKRCMLWRPTLQPAPKAHSLSLQRHEVLGLGYRATVASETDTGLDTKRTTCLRPEDRACIVIYTCTYIHT